MTAPALARSLHNTCWTGRLGDVTQSCKFIIQPSFYHNGGTFNLKYFLNGINWDQAVMWAGRKRTRDGAQIIALQTKFNDITYTGEFDGSNTMVWSIPGLPQMTWMRVNCGGD